MQRWMMIAGMVFMLGCVGMMGGYKWLQNEKANRPDRVWVPIPLNAKYDNEQHEAFASRLRTQLGSDEILGKISEEMELQSRGDFPTEEAALVDLRTRFICEVGEHNYAPSLNIGFRGVARENAMLRELTERVMKDFQAVVKNSNGSSEAP